MITYAVFGEKSCFALRGCYPWGFITFNRLLVLLMCQAQNSALTDYCLHRSNAVATSLTCPAKAQHLDESIQFLVSTFCQLSIISKEASFFLSDRIASSSHFSNSLDQLLLTVSASAPSNHS